MLAFFLNLVLACLDTELLLAPQWQLHAKDDFKAHSTSWMFANVPSGHLAASSSRCTCPVKLIGTSTFHRDQEENC